MSTEMSIVPRNRGWSKKSKWLGTCDKLAHHGSRRSRLSKTPAVLFHRRSSTFPRILRGKERHEGLMLTQFGCKCIESKPSRESATKWKCSTSCLCNCSPAHIGKMRMLTRTAIAPPIAIEYNRSTAVLNGSLTRYPVAMIKQYVNRITLKPYS